jgi:hypothetical protein
VEFEQNMHFEAEHNIAFEKQEQNLRNYNLSYIAEVFDSDLFPVVA